MCDEKTDYRTRRGYSRVEFLAIKKDLFDLFKAGFNIRSAHDKLVEDGKIKYLTYESLCYYLKKGVKLVRFKETIRNENHLSPKVKQVVLAPNEEDASTGSGDAEQDGEDQGSKIKLIKPTELTTFKHNKESYEVKKDGDD